MFLKLSKKKKKKTNKLSGGGWRESCLAACWEKFSSCSLSLLCLALSVLFLS